MRTKKLGLAAVAVIALFIGFATPAGASNPLEVKSGFLRTVIGDFDLTPGSQGTPPCPEKDSTLNFTTTANPNRWTLTGGFSGQFQLPPASGNWYQADFTILGTTATGWAGTAPTQTLTGNIIIQVRISVIGADPGPYDCSKTNVVCTINSSQALKTVAPTQSTYKVGTGNPGLPATTVGDQITVYSQGIAVLGACQPPFSGVGGTTVTIDNLQVTLV